MLAGQVTSAQLANLKVGSCIKVKGVLARKLQESKYTLQLDNSSEKEDVIILATIYSGGLGEVMQGSFEVQGNEKLNYTNLNGTIKQRHLPVLKASNRCQNQTNEKQKEVEKYGTKKQFFRKD